MSGKAAQLAETLARVSDLIGADGTRIDDDGTGAGGTYFLDVSTMVEIVHEVQARLSDDFFVGNGLYARLSEPWREHEALAVQAGHTITAKSRFLSFMGFVKDNYCGGGEESSEESGEESGGEESSEQKVLRRFVELAAMVRYIWTFYNLPRAVAGERSNEVKQDQKTAVVMLLMEEGDDNAAEDSEGGETEDGGNELPEEEADDADPSEGGTRVQVFVRDLSGRSHQVWVRPDIDDVVDICRIMMIPQDSRLISGGRQLIPTHTLSTYNIGAETTIHYIGRLRGGTRGKDQKKNLRRIHKHDEELQNMKKEVDEEDFDSAELQEEMRLPSAK